MASLGVAGVGVLRPLAPSMLLAHHENVVKRFPAENSDEPLAVFGIDAFTHRVGNRLVLNPLSEINARSNMGWNAAGGIRDPADLGQAKKMV